MAKKIPVSSVTPKSKVADTSEASKDRTRKLVLAIATTAIPVGKVATAAAKVKAAGAAKTIESGEAIKKTKTFVQGKNATVTESGPARLKMGERQPQQGTKVTVEYNTKKISPGQAAWQQEGLKTMSKVKTRGVRAKDAATAVTAYQYKEAADKSTQDGNKRTRNYKKNVD